MSTDSASELEAFRQFADAQVSHETVRSVDELLARCQEYRDKLARLCEALRPAIEEADRGEARPLDRDTLLAERTRRLQDMGCA